MEFGNLNQFCLNCSKKTGCLATLLPGLEAMSAEADRQRVLQGYCPVWRYGIWTRRAKNQVCRQPEGDCRDCVSSPGVWPRLLVNGPFFFLCGAVGWGIPTGFSFLQGCGGEAGVLATPFMSANRSPPVVVANKEIIGCEKVLSGFFAWRSSGWEF